MKQNPRVCMVTTVREPGDSFESFLRHHLAIGFERIYVFFDDPKDSAILTAKKIKGVLPIPCDSQLRRKYKSLRNFPALGPRLKTRVEARQMLNATIGRDRAMKEKFDWIFHMDCDELIYNSFNLSIGEVLAQVPDSVDQVHCVNLEAVPQSVFVENPFIDITLFKKNFSMFKNRSWKKNKFYKKYFVKTKRMYFSSTKQGKAGARVRADLYPGIHHFLHKDVYQGKIINEKIGLPIETVNIEELVIYHYPISGFSHFLTKYKLWSKVADKNLGKIFDAYAVKAFRAGDFNELEKLYKDNVQFTDKVGIKGLLKAGIFIQNKKISRAITKIIPTKKRRLIS